MHNKNFILLLIAFSLIQTCLYSQNSITILPVENAQVTAEIQNAIDSLSKSGGGTVVLAEGRHISGGLELRSNITLNLAKGALLLGSDKYSDYNAKHDAFIYGENLTNIAITGEGTIDGADCNNPNGEEGFRGPHCIRLINCNNLKFTGIKIVRSANWAINCRNCSNGFVANVTILAGHDGLHTRFCSNFTVKGCDFRTGDDCFAGNDNKDFDITDCKINSSCNGFRFGCLNLSVRNCKFWGPGESVHKIQKRNNMLAAFVHFSPSDENPSLVSGNWKIEDCTVDNVDNFYNYNFESGLWQTGKPVTNVQFKNIKATNLLKAFNIVGDAQRQLKLSVQNSSFTYREGTEVKQEIFEGVKFASDAFFNAKNFGSIELKGVTIQKSGKLPLELSFGNKLTLADMHPESLLKEAKFTSIKKIEKK